VTLQAKVETNPQLKSPLQQVSIATTLSDATTADVDPPGGSAHHRAAESVALIDMRLAS